MPISKEVVHLLSSQLGHYRSSSDEKKAESHSSIAVVGQTVSSTAISIFSWLTGSSTQSGNKELRDSLRGELDRANTDDEWIALILKLGQNADLVQLNTAGSHSLCAEVLHLVRLSLLDEIDRQNSTDPSSSLVKALDARIAQEKTILSEQCLTRAKHRSGNKNDKTRADAQASIDKTRHNLCYLGETSYLLDVEETETYKLYPKKNTFLQLCFEYPASEMEYGATQLETTLPFILHRDFTKIFYKKHTHIEQPAQPDFKSNTDIPAPGNDGSAPVDSNVVPLPLPRPGEASNIAPAHSENNASPKSSTSTTHTLKLIQPQSVESKADSVEAATNADNNNAAPPASHSESKQTSQAILSGSSSDAPAVAPTNLFNPTKETPPSQVNTSQALNKKNKRK